MAQLLAAAGGQNGGIRNGTEVRIGGDAKLCKAGRQTDLLDERGQRIDTGSSRLLNAALGCDTPDILRKPCKPRRAGLVDMAVQNGVDHRQTCTVVAVGVRAQLVLQHMRNREQIYGQEAAELLRNITVYHCMRRDQLLRLYPGKEGVIENLLRYLVKQQRIFYNTDRDCYGDVPDCREDRELTAALAFS